MNRQPRKYERNWFSWQQLFSWQQNSCVNPTPIVPQAASLVLISSSKKEANLNSIGQLLEPWQAFKKSFFHKEYFSIFCHTFVCPPSGVGFRLVNLSSGSYHRSRGSLYTLRTLHRHSEFHYLGLFGIQTSRTTRVRKYFNIQTPLWLEVWIKLDERLFWRGCYGGGS